MDDSKYTKPNLRKKLFDKIKKGNRGGDAGEWSARKAQLLAKEYKEQGGGYKKAPNADQKSLKKWSNQNWMTSDTYKNLKKGRDTEVKSEGTKRYLPKKAWQNLTDKEVAETNLSKQKGNAKGNQFVAQPKEVAKKVKKYRN